MSAFNKFLQVLFIVGFVLYSKAQSIVDIAVDNGFSTLVNAVVAAGLDETLASDGTYTVFAPTDEAFAKLPSSTLESLLEPVNVDLLTDILLYHVAGQIVYSNEIQDGDQLTMLNDEIVTFSAKSKCSVRVNNAKITMADVIADNGVVHVINEVLLPPGVSRRLSETP